MSIRATTSQFLITGATARPLDEGAVLLVGALAPAVASERLPGVDVLAAESAAEACRRVGTGVALGVVFVDLTLPDCSGPGLLARIGEAQPRAARVLLVDHEDEVPDVEEQVALGLDAVWLRPSTVAGLLRRVGRDAESLCRTRMLQRYLALSRAALQRLERRHRDLRATRTRLAASVRHVLDDADGPVEAAGLSDWWRDYMACVEVEETPGTASARPTALDRCLDDALRQFRTLRPAQRAWAVGVRAAGEGARVQLHADPVLLTRGLVHLLEGIAEIAAEDAPLEISCSGAAGTDRRVLLGVAAVNRRLPSRSGDLVDPFARLPGAELDGWSMALVLAATMLRGQGVVPVLDAGAARFRVGLQVGAALGGPL